MFGKQCWPVSTGLYTYKTKSFRTRTLYQEGRLTEAYYYFINCLFQESETVQGLEVFFKVTHYCNVRQIGQISREAPTHIP